MSDYEQDDNNDNSVSSILNGIVKKKPDTLLHHYAEMDNIAENLDEKELNKIAFKVINGHDVDKQSQKEWLSKVEAILRLAKLTKEPKNTPLPQSSNIKFPLITNACCQFAARTYPELIQDGKIVKPDIVGQTNPQLELDADGICDFMSYQLLGPDSEWEASMDRLLNVLPHIGFVVKKTYYDPKGKKNISDVCKYNDIVLRNAPDINSIDDLRRVTHVLYQHPNDLVMQCRAGLYLEDSVEKVLSFYSEFDPNPVCRLYEQHQWMDLDNDGLEEPYIVTVHVDTMKVLRIKARFDKDDIETDENDDTKITCIKATQYFTDFHFVPASDGSFMSVGFGTLLLDINETVNTILNQLIDAGTLANMQTGFIDSRLKIMGGQIGVDPGQWNRVKGVIGQTIKEGVFPLNYKEPSTVLFQLLGMLIKAAEDLTSSTDALQGAQNAQNVPATSMLAMIEQGMKLHSAIQRRLYRGLKEEFRKLFKLNKKFLNPDDFIEVVGSKSGINPDAFRNPSIQIVPVADPNLSSDAQRLSQAQVVMALEGKPGVDNNEVHKRLLQAARVPNIDAILPPSKAKEANNPPPDPKMLQVQMAAKSKAADLQIKSRHQDLKEKQFAASMPKTEAEITQIQSNSVALIAKAAKLAHEAKMDEVGNQLDAIKTKMDATAQAHQQMMDAAHTGIELQQNQQTINNQHQQAVTGLQLQGQAQDDARNAQQSNDSGVDTAPSNDQANGASDESPGSE